MTFNRHVNTAVSSSPGSKGAHTQSLILNLTHEAKRETETGRERERERKGAGTKREGDRDRVSVCVCV